MELALLVAPYGQALHADKDATANVSAGHVSAVYSQDGAPATDRVLTGQLAEEKAKRGTQEQCNAHGSAQSKGSRHSPNAPDGSASAAPTLCKEHQHQQS